MEGILEDNQIDCITTTDKAHHKNGLIEISIRWVKRTMSKLWQESPGKSGTLIASETASAHNQLASYNGKNSPYFRVFGTNSNITTTIDTSNLELGQAASTTLLKQRNVLALKAR